MASGSTLVFSQTSIRIGTRLPIFRQLLLHAESIPIFHLNINEEIQRSRPRVRSDALIRVRSQMVWLSTRGGFYTRKNPGNAP